MLADAQQFLGTQRTPALDTQASRALSTSGIVYVGDPVPTERIGDQSGCECRQTQPQTATFLLVMAMLSIAHAVGGRLIEQALLRCFGVSLDPWVLSIVLQGIASLVGLGVAASFSKVSEDAVARRHVRLTLLAAMGIGLILAWLSHLVDHASVLSWVLVPVYLLWAWAEAISSPIAPMAGV